MRFREIKFLNVNEIKKGNFPVKFRISAQMTIFHFLQCLFNHRIKDMM